MEKQIKTALISQFGATIDMLKNLLEKSPDFYYNENKRFFYMSFHTIIFLDYYSSLNPNNFNSKLKFTKVLSNEKPDFSIDDLIPNKQYSKIEMIDYINTLKIKILKIINKLNENNIDSRFVEGNENEDLSFSILEILLYNLRHTQHHVAQLNLMLRQDLDLHLDWSFKNNDLFC